MEDELQITLTNDYAFLSIVHPCTMERTSFGTTETSLLLETTAVRGGTENPFENRWSRYEELAENKAQAYL